MWSKRTHLTADWIIFFASVWLLMAPFVLSYVNTSARTNDIWSGLIIGVLVILKSFLFVSKIRITQITFFMGFWLIFAPLVFNYTNSSAQVNDVIIGVSIVLLAGWNLYKKHSY